LKIFLSYFFELGIELIPCLPALIIAVLPSLDEPNEELQKNILSMLDSVCESAGYRFFYEAMWLAMLRVSKVRVQALKIVSSRLKARKCEKPCGQERPIYLTSKPQLLDTRYSS